MSVACNIFVYFLGEKIEQIACLHLHDLQQMPNLNTLYALEQGDDCTIITVTLALPLMHPMINGLLIVSLTIFI